MAQNPNNPFVTSSRPYDVSKPINKLAQQQSQQATGSATDQNTQVVNPNPGMFSNNTGVVGPPSPTNPAADPGLAAAALKAALAPPAGGFGQVAGFEQGRLNNASDNDPKTVFGRYASSLGGHMTGDNVRSFVAGDPRWEIDPATAAGADPHIRVKQNELDKWKPGTSIYQDVIKDSGGANAAQFLNADGTVASPSGSDGSGSLLPPPTSPSAAGPAYNPANFNTADPRFGQNIIAQLMQQLALNKAVQG